MCVCVCVCVSSLDILCLHGFNTTFCFHKSKQSCAYDSRLEISLPLVEVMLEVLPWLKMPDEVVCHSSVSSSHFVVGTVVTWL